MISMTQSIRRGALFALGLALAVPAQSASAFGNGGGGHHATPAGHAAWSPRGWGYWNRGRHRYNHDFVQRRGPNLYLNGRPFKIAGANNYYLFYQSQFMVDDVLETAADNDFNVIRTWGFADIGNQDGSNSVHGKAGGEVYFQYWDGSGPAYNDGENGLERLDYVIHKAGELGLKLVIPLTNNWSDFGGMDQYVMWAGGEYHDDFYTDPQIRQWYKDWIAHVLNRENSYTGVKYKNDPAILAWELGNEPRCVGSGVYPRSERCDENTVTEWAETMSAHIKSIDPRHLVSAGDEGFLCDPEADDWTENCNDGVDSVALARLPHIDMLSYHLYPDHWGKSAEWGTEWIKRHIKLGHRIGKPAYLGEFGWQDKSTRNTVFKEWTDTILRYRGDGSMYWILSGLQDNGTLYPDYDGFSVYCPGPVCTAYGNYIDRLHYRDFYFPPVADHDRVVTEFESPAVLDPAANDIAYLWADVVPGSVDLDPDAEGRQTTAAVTGGTFEVQADNTVAFTPEPGFSGEAVAEYTVADSFGTRSNIAALIAEVQPDPAAAITLYSFETGTEGWASASWQDGAGSVSHTTDFATDGSGGLRIEASGGGWFGLNLAEPLDISDKTRIVYDMRPEAAGTNAALALQVGDDFTWCQLYSEWVNPGTTHHAEIELSDLDCADPDLGDVRAIWVRADAGTTLDIDNVVAE